VPKQTFKIEGFHGGLNSNSDPRDIRDNESPSLKDVAIDSVGKIKTLGSFNNGILINSGTAQDLTGNSVDTRTTLSLSSGASASDDYYNGMTLTITAGLNNGSTFTITDYDATGHGNGEKIAVLTPTASTGFNLAGTNSTTYEIRGGDSNTSSILKNTGLFVMSSDRKIDGTLSNETLIFLHDNTTHTIDIKDSDEWNEEEISLAGSASTVYYTVDGVLRVSDSTLTRVSRWYGYISDQRFASLNAAGPTAAWSNVNQSLASPALGKCLISTPIVGSDSNGIFSSASEYIGTVINDGTSSDQVVDHSSVNLRVGIQLNEIIFDSTHSEWVEDTRCVVSDSSDIYPCIGTKVTKVTGSSTSFDYSYIAENSLSFALEESNSLIFPVFVTSSEITKLVKFEIMVGKTSIISSTTDPSPTDSTISWVFGAEKIKPNMWNFLVCSSDNISFNSDQFPMSNCDVLGLFMHDNVSPGSTSADKMDYYVSGIALAEASSINGFTPGSYTFYHTYLYDVENKQESLPFVFNHVDRSSSFVLTGSIDVTGTNTNVPGSGTAYLTELKVGDEITVSGETRIIATITDDTTATVTVAWGSNLANDTSPECNPVGEPDNVNSINVVGSSVLFNFDAYICSNNAAGNGYGLNKRISGSRLYYKKEENDNYFLIGELDFIDKGFKFLPEADTVSYTMINTTDATAPILSKTALIKEISPETANTIDTFKTINGFSTEVKSLDAQYKTAVVHGRRVYIGNIKRPDGKTHPDRIIKSQVNRFDTFPEGMGSVDVVIRDGENIVKLEAYADRILQFKQHSLYIINVSESVDFLEDTYRNKGCAFDYHVTRTDMGIVWFNDHGCYLYNGKSVLDLLERQGIRLINEEDWEAFVTDGVDGSADDPDMSSAMIGYVPKKKHLIIKNENNDIHLYDFVLQAWTTGIGKITESTAMTNFALDADQNLFYIDNTTTVRKTWQTSVQTSTGFEYITPDIDFGQPGVRKKVYKVYVTYKSGATTNVQVDYGVNGGTTFPYDFANGDNFTSNELGSASGWQVAELKPDNATESNNIKSFQLRFATDGIVPSGFEINDITIVYRLKNIK
tara:strand:+ start:237 stop:3482 length:3246 start_codon:yes stop_codon:yes gene_type:complete